MRTFDGLSGLPGTTFSTYEVFMKLLHKKVTWLFSREHVDARNFFTSSLIGSKVFFPAHEGPSADGGWGTAVLLLSVVDFVPVVVPVVVVLVVVVPLDVVDVTEGVVVVAWEGFDVVADVVQSTLSGQSHCLLDGLKRRPGRITIV